MLAVAGGGYRGLLGAREWLYGRGLLKSRALPCRWCRSQPDRGGTGKTPAVEVAVQTLVALGHRPRSSAAATGERRARPDRGGPASISLDPEESGDEPFLLARRLPGIPVVVGANRHDAARAAIEKFGVTAIVLDDGFQHRTLAKDLEIVDGAGAASVGKRKGCFRRGRCASRSPRSRGPISSSPPAPSSG